MVVENTLQADEIYQRSALGQTARGLQHVLVQNNLGISNKGVGELDMLALALEQLDVDEFASVGYFTGRRLVTNPYVFEVTEGAKRKVVVGNPDFQSLDGELVESEKHGMYGDMYFSMPTDVMREYSKYCQIEIGAGLGEGVGSEQLLYRFLQQRKDENVWLSAYGFLRWEQLPIRGLGRLPFTKGRWHIC